MYLLAQPQGRWEMFAALHQLIFHVVFTQLSFWKTSDIPAKGLVAFMASKWHHKYEWSSIAKSILCCCTEDCYFHFIIISYWVGSQATGRHSPHQVCSSLLVMSYSSKMPCGTNGMVNTNNNDVTAMYRMKQQIHLKICTYLLWLLLDCWYNKSAPTRLSYKDEVKSAKQMGPWSWKEVFFVYVL